MAIELGAGLIISHFDAVLQKVILLASFMPVISAVSGNVGLQAAAITVRALDTRGGARKNIWTSLKKEAATSFLMAMACGLILGAVGAIWAKHLPFGVVIGVAITCSMLTAGFMGTVIPMVSKRFGFDPATTAGPFETAFQDIVGFAVFLGLATLLQHWMI
jgi:magnesium transporter